MHNSYIPYPCSYCAYAARSSSTDDFNPYGTYACPYCNSQQMYSPDFSNQYTDEYYPNMNERRFALSQPPKGSAQVVLKDYGPQPFVTNLEEAAIQNPNYRTALWTGPHMQLTLMSIDVGDDIGVEVHPVIDQFIRVEEGEGIAQMGPSKDNLNYQRSVSDGFAVFVPAGTWHNVVNTGTKPLKLYSIYAPPQHPRGTIHETKAIAHAGSTSDED